MKRDPLLPTYLLDVVKFEEISLPYNHKEEAGMMFTDICSFTKITELVSSKGHYGVEIITEILNIYFEEMLSCLQRYGGSLMKFGGDALFALFPGKKEEVIPCMMSCRDEMYRSLTIINKQFKKKYGIEINFNGAMGWGEIYLNIVGDVQYHYDYYVDGTAIGELFILGEKSLPGEMLLTDEMFPFTGIRGEPPVSSPKYETQIGKCFLPDKVIKKIQEKDFSAELRNSAVIFIHLSDKGGNEQIDYQAYHQYYKELQRNVYSLDGTINKIDYADKGYLILITFGTPYSHLNDVERAVTCCYRIQKIRSDKISPKIGLTYSNIFAGILGGSERYEYGIIGNGVNIAARLMANSYEGEVSFSEDIIDNVSSRFETEFIEETYVKGIKTPLRIHKIVNELPGFWNVLESKYKDKKVVAYLQELSKIRESFRDNDQKLLILTGEAGTGKSFLAYQLIKDYIEQGHDVSIHIMEEYNRNSQCEWYLSILNRKLTIDEPVRDFYLLEDYCKKSGFSFDSELVLKFFKAIRDSSIELQKEEFEIVYENQSEILFSLLKESKLFFLDDIQFLDKTSLQIFRKTVPKLLRHGTVVILTSRGEETFQGMEQLQAGIHLRLENLKGDEAQSFVKNEISSISSDAIRTIINITNGNPLFMMEMCSIIKKNIYASHSIVAESDLKRMEKEGIISDKIENLLINEYENLNEDLKMTLRIASVIGKAFSLDEITIVSDEKMKEYFSIIDELSENSYIEKKAFDSGIEYIFNNHLMRDAIYRTILLSQKRELHNKIGSYYQEKFSDDQYPYLELIANHYLYADNGQAAQRFCYLAGEKTARLAAYPESNYYFENALKYCEDKNDCYKILIAMTNNYVSQGDANKATEYLETLEEEYPELLNDRFYLLKIRTMVLKGMYQHLSEYIPTIKPKLKEDYYKYMMEFHYMNALQYVNRLEEFENIAADLYPKLQKLNDTQLTANYLVSMALHYMNRSDYKTAEKYYRELHEIAKEEGDLINLRIALNGLGVTASRTGDKALAKEYMTQGLEICEKLGDKNGYSRLIMDLGTLYRNEGNIHKAIEFYEKSLQTAQIIGNQHQESIALYSIGEAYFYQLDDKDIALSFLLKSREISEKIGDLVGVSFCNDAIGDVYFTKGDNEEAFRIYTANLELQYKLKDNEGIAHTLGNLGNIAKVQKDYKKAESYYSQQIDILTEVGDLDGKGRAFFNWAMIELEQEKLPSSREKLKKAIELFKKCNAAVLIEIAEEQLKKMDSSS